MIRLPHVGLLLAVSLLGACGMSEEEQIQKMEELRQAIAEQVPLGSSSDQVEAFLVDQGFDEPETTGSRGGDSFLDDERPDLKDQARYTTNAAIKDVYRGFLRSESIYLRFYYDEDRKLIWSVVVSRADGI